MRKWLGVYSVQAAQASWHPRPRPQLSHLRHEANPQGSSSHTAGSPRAALLQPDQPPSRQPREELRRKAGCDGPQQSHLGQFCQRSKIIRKPTEGGSWRNLKKKKENRLGQWFAPSPRDLLSVQTPRWPFFMHGGQPRVGEGPETSPSLSTIDFWGFVDECSRLAPG